MITYLYHKRHTQTGLNYFGKTTNDPYNYLGSGTYWTRHLKQHGTNIETVQVWKFNNLDECSKFAIEFSLKNKIVESSEWANLKVENGLDGGHTPSAYTPEARLKKSNKLKGRQVTQETRSKLSKSKKGKGCSSDNAMYGKSQSNFCKIKAKETLSQTMQCQHCNKITNLGNYKRWHGTNCKKKAP